MRRLTLPLLVLLAAWTAVQGWWTLPFSEATWQLLGRGLLVTAFLLAWRFRRGRLAAATLLVAALQEGRFFPIWPEILPWVGLLFPLHLALLPFVREWWVMSVAGLWRFGLLALEGALLVHLVSHEAWWVAPTQWIRTTSWVDLPSLAMPQTVALAYGFAVVILGTRLVRRRSPLEAGLLGVLGASALASQEMFLGVGMANVTLYLAAAGAILVLTPLESAFSLAFEDGLTGLPARRALEESLRHMGRHYSLAMADIDHFKKLNDRHGHEVGDQVLRMIARELEKVGGGGQAFRYGGEEFTLLFPGRSADEAADAADRLRKRIAQRSFAVRSPSRPKKKPKSKKPSSGQKRLKVTVSLGVAERSATLTRPEQVLKAADKALYKSKKAGRNRVTVGR